MAKGPMKTKIQYNTRYNLSSDQALRIFHFVWKYIFFFFLWLSYWEKNDNRFSSYGWRVSEEKIFRKVLFTLDDTPLSRHCNVEKFCRFLKDHFYQLRWSGKLFFLYKYFLLRFYTSKCILIYEISWNIYLFLFRFKFF